jgi:hypothetical protein
MARSRGLGDVYKRQGFIGGVEKNSVCRSCFNKELSKNEEVRKKQSESAKLRVRSEEEIQRAKDLLKVYGNKRSLQEIWSEKFDEAEVEELLEKRNGKVSVATTGEGNPMFGKVPAKGTGQGWSGWYKGTYFRSLHELGVIINWLEAEGLPWESAEDLKFMIPYVNAKGVKRNYFPDFFVNGILIEVKPRRLWNTEEVVIKREAGVKFCKERGWEFVIADRGKPSWDYLVKLIEQGSLILLPKYQSLLEKIC